MLAAFQICMSVPLTISLPLLLDSKFQDPFDVTYQNSTADRIFHTDPFELFDTFNEIYPFVYSFSVTLNILLWHFLCFRENTKLQVIATCNLYT